tara:strand:+ start:847 stop:1818 length:972 start_codon:yes stop_codon:yes gene_type:complete
MSAAHLVGIRGVTLRGLSSRQDLNGTEVDVQSYSEPRYVVLLADGTSIRVKPENLIVKAVGNDSCFATQKHGEMLESIGRYDEAADVYREILHGSEAGSLSHPGVEAVIWNNIGLAHKRGMRFKRAKMAYLECIAACTDQGPKETIIAMLAKMINQYDALDEPPLPAGHPDALEGDLQAEFFSILSTLFDPYRPAGHYKISQGFDLVSPESRRLANRDYFMAVSYAPPRLDAVWVYSFVDDPNGKKGVRRLTDEEVAAIPADSRVRTTIGTTGVTQYGEHQDAGLFRAMDRAGAQEHYEQVTVGGAKQVDRECQRGDRDYFQR